VIDQVLPALRCPMCSGGLARFDNAVGCSSGHRFDVARQGYVSLLGPRSRTDTGDTAEMVAARADFLARGHYAPIADAIVGALSDRVADQPLVVEIGAGTGYYLGAALDALSGARGIALDASARAARRAAADPRIGSVVADAWAVLPIRDHVADAVLSVFAPRNPSQLARILTSSGRLVVVAPNTDHLGELIEPLGMLNVGADKDRKLAVGLSPYFAPAGSRALSYQLRLGVDDLRNLVLMGPAAQHVRRDQLAASLDDQPVLTQATVSVTVSCWTPLA
jgi:23S rRNA (guanine745-N1)-methyltransferase